MLEAKRSGTQESTEERLEGQQKDEVGVTPLGIPMLAGPGAISTVMVLMGQSKYWWQAAPVFAAIAITALSSAAILAAASRVRVVLGETGNPNPDAVDGPGADRDRRAVRDQRTDGPWRDSAEAGGNVRSLRL